MNIRETIRRNIFKLSWDTRSRNVDVINILKRLATFNSSVLDVGCGEYGLASFHKKARIVSIDTIDGESWRGSSLFVRGSILRLPFADNSYDFVTSVDVFEHLPEAVRDLAVAELVRVASIGVVVAFPFDPNAPVVDSLFRTALISSKKTVPSWLDEHLAQPHPKVDDMKGQIESEIRNQECEANIEVHYSEPLWVTSLIRRLACVSPIFYVFTNLFFGIFFRLIRSSNRENAYRAILVATFRKSVQI